MTQDPASTSDAASKDSEAPRRNATAAAHAAAWAFVFLILRIFAVSGYDWSTAFAVSTTLGLDDGLGLLFGSLMAGHLLTSLLLMAVVPLLVAAYLWGPSGHRPVVMLLGTLSLVTLAALTTTFHTWWVPVGTVVLLGLFALVRRLPRQSGLRRVSMAALSRVGWIAGVAVLLVAAFVQTPWVPLEHIETTNGTISGYVLSVDPGFLNVLTDDQEFVILISGEVLSRD